MTKAMDNNKVFLFVFQMMRVRKMLTEVLLDVTNKEISEIAQDVYDKEKNGHSKVHLQHIFWLFN